MQLWIRSAEPCGNLGQKSKIIVYSLVEDKKTNISVEYIVLLNNTRNSISIWKLNIQAHSFS